MCLHCLSTRPGWGSSATGQAAILKVSDLLPALASTVQGLNEGEWASTVYAADIHVLVRTRLDQPDPTEDAGEPDYADQDDQETYEEDYDSKA